MNLGDMILLFNQILFRDNWLLNYQLLACTKGIGQKFA
jgi:hypothetical protein